MEKPATNLVEVVEPDCDCVIPTRLQENCTTIAEYNGSKIIQNIVRSNAKRSKRADFNQLKIPTKRPPHSFGNSFIKNITGSFEKTEEEENSQNITVCVPGYCSDTDFTFSKCRSNYNFDSMATAGLQKRLSSTMMSPSNVAATTPKFLLPSKSKAGLQKRLSSTMMSPSNVAATTPKFLLPSKSKAGLQKRLSSTMMSPSNVAATTPKFPLDPDFYEPLTLDLLMRFGKNDKPTTLNKKFTPLGKNGPQLIVEKGLSNFNLFTKNCLTFNVLYISILLCLLKTFPVSTCFGYYIFPSRRNEKRTRKLIQTSFLLLLAALT